MPDVAIELIDRPRDKPWGAGERSAAISNAVFEATGMRLRSVPFKPETVKTGPQRT